MKQSQNARKQRGRSAPRKGGKINGGGNRNNEPKVRGNPKQLLEKYKTQAREAKQAGDRVQAEYFYQFADHYQRILNEMTARNGGQNQRDTEQADTEQPEDQEAANPRRGRGRRQRDEVTSEAVASEEQQAADPGAVEQPTEVHPELDLDGTAAESKPKRRRAPRRPAKASPGADVDVEASPEGNEAA